jgi:hypothetical protein
VTQKDLEYNDFAIKMLISNIFLTFSLGVYTSRYFNSILLSNKFSEIHYMVGFTLFGCLCGAFKFYKIRKELNLKYTPIYYISIGKL